MDIDELKARALAWLGIPLAQAGPDAEQAGHVAARRTRDAAVKALAKPADVGILAD